MDAKEMSLAICKAASNKKASDIVTMDMRELSASTDYFVVCSAQTATQVRAIADGIEEELAPGCPRVLCDRAALGRCTAQAL